MALDTPRTGTRPSSDGPRCTVNRDATPPGVFREQRGKFVVNWTSWGCQGGHPEGLEGRWHDARPPERPGHAPGARDHDYRFVQAQGVDMTADSSALADKTDAASIADWALEAVTWTSAKGLLGGYDNHDGTFTISPDGETARVEAAKVLVATYKLLIDSKL